MKLLLPVLTLMLATVLFCCSGNAAAVPAAGKSLGLVQPDGSSFQARLYGDEFMKVLTTADGKAIIQEPSGWYCYATYDGSGTKISSGIRVGEPIPGDVAAASMDIPYSIIGEASETLRAAVPGQTYSLMSAADGPGSPGNGQSGTVYERRGIVLLVEFKDLKFTYRKDDFTALLGAGYNGRQGAAAYFNDQFNGLCNFSFDVSGIITLDKSYMYYGQNERSATGKDSRAAEMVTDACKAADRSIDFSLYDQDKDGKADNVFIIYAGADEADGAGDYHIWSHSWYLHEGAGINLTLDGVRIDRYACASELSGESISGIGTFCHEYCHALGLIDMYDTDYMGSGGLAEGLWGSTSIMDKGNRNDNGNTPPNFNAIEMDMLGLPECITITEEGTYELEPIDSGRKYCRIDSDTPGEYYLLECRIAEGWDRYIGGSGLLVYHIDKSTNDSGYGLSAYSRWQLESNSVNTNPRHQCADLIEASAPGTYTATADLSADISSIFFPCGDITAFGPETDPAFLFWNGSSPVFNITDITRTEAGISFRISKSASSLMPEAVITGKDVFQDAAIISWKIEPGFSGKSFAVWGKKGGEMQAIEVKPFSATATSVNYAVTLDSLEDRTDYSVTIFCEQDGTKGYPADASFTTKELPQGGHPYIFMKYVQRNMDGSFPVGVRLPLRLFNAKDAEAIEWTYDGRPVKTGENGYFSPGKSGTLRATAYFSDGSREIITKEIIIREVQQ